MTHSKAELTVDKQILYLVQWFAEFSDFQRNDFLVDHLLKLFGQFLKENLLDSPEQLNGNVGQTEETITNGIDSIDLANCVRPPSIFQCRMKLFKEWYPNWCDNEKIEFLTRLRNIDSAFVAEFYRTFLKEHNIADQQTLVAKIKDGIEQNMLAKRLELGENIFVLSSGADVAANTTTITTTTTTLDHMNVSNDCKSPNDSTGVVDGKSSCQTPDLLNDVTDMIVNAGTRNGDDDATVPTATVEPNEKNCCGDNETSCIDTDTVTNVQSEPGCETSAELVENLPNTTGNDNEQQSHNDELISEQSAPPPDLLS